MAATRDVAAQRLQAPKVLATDEGGEGGNGGEAGDGGEGDDGDDGDEGDDAGDEIGRGTWLAKAAKTTMAQKTRRGAEAKRSP